MRLEDAAEIALDAFRGAGLADAEIKMSDGPRAHVVASVGDERFALTLIGDEVADTDFRKAIDDLPAKLRGC